MNSLGSCEVLPLGFFGGDKSRKNFVLEDVIFGPPLLSRSFKALSSQYRKTGAPIHIPGSYSRSC